MKKLLLTILTATLLIFSFSFFASAAKITVDGKPVEVVAYNIKGNNYFKLRDIAHLLNGTQKQFDVGWNNEAKAVTITTSTPYSADDTLTTVPISNPIATTNYPNFLIDGRKAPTTAYNISNNNYFKLRDLASLLDFNVVYDSETKIIGIDTTASYEFPKSDGTFSINPEYVSLIGKTRADAVKLFGEGVCEYNYSQLYTAETFSNGFIACYDGDTMDSNAAIKRIKLPFNMLFNNIPSTVTTKDLEKLFFEYRYNHDYGFFEANYNGEKITFRAYGGVITTSELIIVGSSSYNSHMKEIVYVGNEWNNTVSMTAEKTYSLYFEENPQYFESTPIGYRCELCDFTGDGVDELCIDETDYRIGYLPVRSYILTIADGKVKLLYELKEGESFWKYENNGSIMYAIHKEISDSEFRIYSLSSDGTTSLFATIIKSFDDQSGFGSVSVNGVSMQPDTPEFEEASRNSVYNSVMPKISPNNIAN